MADTDKDRDDEVDDQEAADDQAGKGAKKPDDKPDAKAKPDGKDAAGEFVEVALDDKEKAAAAEDARLSAADQAETVEAKRARRKQEKVDRRDRQRAARAARDRELEELRGTVAELKQGQQAVGERLTADKRQALIAKGNALKAEIDDATKLIAKAGSAGNGDVLAEALSIRDNASYELRQIGAYLQQQDARAKAGGNGAEQRQPPIAPAVKRRVDEFRAAHPWYDGQGNDDDSAIVTALDARVAREGYDPAGPEYWDELKRRVAAKLPHRFKEDDADDEDEGAEDKGKRPDAAARRGPQLGSGRSGVGAGGSVRVFVSAERRKAMEDAGIWDDPVRRAKQIKAYAQYDQDHRETAH